MLPDKNFENQYLVKAYFVFGFAMYICFYHLISNAMLAQLQSPPFIFNDADWAYKIFKASGIPQFVTSNAVIASLFDISLLVFTIGLLLSRRRIFAVLFTVVLLNYFFTYNLTAGHHYHGLIGVLVISIPFWFKGEERFNLAWQGVRYYLLYVFSSAALWKILRGSAFYTDQLSNILKFQQTNLLLQNPGNYKAHIAQYLIANPEAAHIILLVNVAVQLSFIIGFFTRKFDMVLLALSVIFVVANFLVMGILSFDLLILTLTLLNWPKVEAYLIKKQVIATS